MVPQERLARLLDKQVIEIAPLAFMRGRTLDRAYVLLDEGQNTTRAQMKMFLTRLGSRGRMVITGDVTQIDLPTRQGSGMVEALRVLQDVKGVGFGRLTSADVVRHPLVADIIEAYDEASQRGER
jgi:phosphate starvation-inducible PhoH-like protein